MLPPFSAEAASTAQTSLPAPVACNNSVGNCWKPAVKARWQYQLQGTPNPKGGCKYKSTGFINIGVTGTSFATGRTVAPTVFDIDILQDGKCYSPQDYSVLNYAAVQAIHVRGARVIGYIDAGTAETWRPDFPEMQAFDQSCDGCLFGNPLSHFPDEYWLNITTDAKGTNPNTGKLQTTRRFLLDEMQTRLQGSQADRRRRDRVRRRRRMAGRQRARDHRAGPAAVQRAAGQHGAPDGLPRRAEERPQPGEHPAALLRLRDQRAVLPVRRVRGARSVALAVRQGRLQRGVRGSTRRRSVRRPTHRRTTSTRSASRTTCSTCPTHPAAEPPPARAPR